jgi:hypothetical protein
MCEEVVSRDLRSKSCGYLLMDRKYIPLLEQNDANITLITYVARVLKTKNKGIQTLPTTKKRFFKLNFI